MSYKDGAIEERNYVYQDGYFSTILSVYVPFGRGVNLEVGDVIRIFDTVVFDGVEIKYVTKHQKMSGKFFDKLVEKFRETSIMESDLSSSKGESENKGTDQEGGSDELGNVIRVKRNHHRKAYQQAQADKMTPAVYRWDFKLTCQSAELLDKQLQAIKDNYDGLADGENSSKKLQDILLIPHTGRQLQAMNDLFSQLDEEDRANAVSTQDNYSGLDIYVSTTLIDDNGVPVGYDSNSKQGGQVFIDFVGSMPRNGVIAIPESQSVKRYWAEHMSKPAPSASILSQAVANQFALEGRKVAHMVLNDYDYFQTQGAHFTGYKDGFEKIDMSMVSVNPLQLEGQREDQGTIYENIQSKMALIMDVLMGFTLESADQVNVKKAVAEVLSRGFWSSDAKQYPLKGKLVGQRWDTYPRVGSVITSLKRQMSSQKDGNTDYQIDRINKVVNSLELVFESNKSLIGRATNLPKLTKSQTYYEFSKVGGDRFKMVQFVNLLNNLSQMLNRGDLLVIHGMQVLDTRIFGEYLKEEFKEIQKRGVRVLFSFDNTTTPHNSSIFSLDKGLLYNSFTNDIDWSFVGYVPKEEFGELEKLYRQRMTDGMKVSLVLPNIEGRGVFYRGATRTLHFVDIMPFI